MDNANFEYNNYHCTIVTSAIPSPMSDKLKLTNSPSHPGKQIQTGVTGVINK